MIRLPVHFGSKLRSKNLEVDFLVVDVPTAYNVILGRPTLHRVKAVIAHTSSSFDLRLTTAALVKYMGTNERPVSVIW